jgi:MFS family permease
VYGAIAGGGAAIGLVLGGTLTQLASWRWTLLINVPIAAHGRRRGPSGRPGESRRIESRVRPSRCRRPSPAGLFLLVYGFTMAGTHGWAAPTHRSRSWPAPLLLLGTFVAVELRSPHPLLPLRVVLDRNRGGSYLASLLVGSAMLGTFLFLTYYFQGTLHYSALKTGFAFLPFSAGIIFGAGMASRFLPRIGPRALMMAGLALAAGGLVWFTRLGVDSSYLGLVLPAEFMVSVGMGTTFVPMSSTALVGVEPKDAGVASALVNTTQQVGGSLGTALLNTLAASAATTYLADHAKTAVVARTAAVHGYTTAFTVSALLLAAAAVVAGVLVRASRHQVQAEAATVTVLPTMELELELESVS